MKINSEERGEAGQRGQIANFCTFHSHFPTWFMLPQSTSIVPPIPDTFKSSGKITMRGDFECSHILTIFKKKSIIKHERALKYGITRVDGNTPLCEPNFSQKSLYLCIYYGAIHILQKGRIMSRA